MHPVRIGLLLLLIPLADLILLGLIARIHWAISILIIAVTMIAGIALIRWRSGLFVWQLARMWKRRMSPAELAMNSVVLTVAGALLMLPGLITDAIGISLLIPRVRRWYGQRMTRYFVDRTSWASVVWGQRSMDGRVVDGQVVDSEFRTVDADSEASTPLETDPRVIEPLRVEDGASSDSIDAESRRHSGGRGRDVTGGSRSRTAS